MTVVVNTAGMKVMSVSMIIFSILLDLQACVVIKKTVESIFLCVP